MNLNSAFNADFVCHFTHRSTTVVLNGMQHDAKSYKKTKRFISRKKKKRMWEKFVDFFILELKIPQEVI